MPKELSAKSARKKSKVTQEPRQNELQLQMLALMMYADALKPHAWIGLDSLLVQPEQKGQTCKPHALALAMKYTSNSFAGTPDIQDIPPTCKSQDPDYAKNHEYSSIRHYTKREKLSAVGEVPSINTLVTIAQAFGFDAEYVKVPMLKEYLSTLVTYVNHGYTPCVYFNVEMTDMIRYGQPRVATDKQPNEHAALVIGYFYAKRDSQLYFIVQQWGDLFLFNGLKLSIASGSLLEKPRGPETFHKIDKGYKKFGRAWINFKNHGFSETKIAELELKYLHQRKTTLKDRVDESGTFQSSILVVKPRVDAKKLKKTGMRLNPMASTSGAVMSAQAKQAAELSDGADSAVARPLITPVADALKPAIASAGHDVDDVGIDKSHKRRKHTRLNISGTHCQ